jgi:hypothetical protein
MKKINIPPVKTSPFAGDCTRQGQLNQSVDKLFKNLPHVKQAFQPAQREAVFTACSPSPDKSHPNKTGEIILSILFFICLIGCAIGGMAL